jgi:hypothetical protein
MTLERASIPAVPEQLTSWLAQAEDLDKAGKLLE